MFIGHFALGYAAKRAAPRVPLPVLFAAAQLADIVWPVLVALGIEHVRIVTGETPFLALAFDSYPWSHSLVTLIVWGAVFGGLYRAFTGDRVALPIIFTLVVSHWVLDFVTHRPDMPLYPGGPKYGLRLWYSVPATLAVEYAMFVIGVAVYARATRPRDAIGRWSFVGFVVLFAVAYAASLGPPPPSVEAIWMAAIVMAALTLAWAWWSDRHRRAIF